MSVVINTSVSGGSSDSSGSGVGSGYEEITGAEFNTLVGTASLVPGTEYYIDAVPARWKAKTTSTYDGVGFLSNGIYIFGDTAFATQTEVDLEAGTWATRPVTGFDSGKMYYRRMTDIGDATGGTVMQWLGGTSTAWRLMHPLRMRLRGSGSVTTSAQYPTNTRFSFPAGFLAGVSRFEILIKFDQSDSTSTLNTWRLKLGTAGTASDSTILSPTSGTPLTANDNQRSYCICAFNINSSTQMFFDGTGGSNVTSVGATGTVNTEVGDAAVTLASSATTADALYLGMDYTMTTSNTALVTTLIVTLYP